uniref:Potassium channel domain-containing protein n=1 Tax=Meloidogyne enterolobii TaxID=390850 RepID=A0A6V7U902_MELEN|nr:unnamed protein product [Meloidogyne enterolobii]
MTLPTPEINIENFDHFEENENKIKIGEKTKRLLRLVGPQLAVPLLLYVYLLFGVFCYRLIDGELKNMPFTELFLFCFGTLTTIGYGNIKPSTSISLLFTMLYAPLGIPLCMLTLANMGKHITKAYNSLTLSLRNKKFLSHSIGQNKRLPLIATITLFILSLCGSAALLSTEETPLFHTDHLYFAVVSFTTLGFGDLYPNTEGNIFRLIGIICLLSVGIIAMGVWFQLVKNWLQKIFCYKKRRFRHARNIQVWFGHKQMRLSNVLEVVAREFNASPMQIHQVLNDLDFLISDAKANDVTEIN